VLRSVGDKLDFWRLVMTSVMKTGKPRVRFVVSASRLGRDTIVEQWGCWTAVEPDSGKSETINGVLLIERHHLHVEFA
jgi:hypothetical protein